MSTRWRTLLLLTSGLALAACTGVEPIGATRGAQLEGPSFVRLTFRDAPDAIVMGGPRFHAVSLRRDELTLSIHASDVVHAPPEEGAEEGPPPQYIVRGAEARMTVNEGIKSVAWREGGAFYALEVECFRPFEDPRCTEDAFVLAQAESLVEMGR